MKQLHTRLSGVLVHPTSFPSHYTRNGLDLDLGIGDLGEAAYKFIDFLKASGQNLWQVLPLGPTGFGDSPYQCFSAFAGQPLLISPEDLVKLALITEEDLKDIPKWDPEHVDYGAVQNYKNRLFKKAFQTFHHTPDKLLLEEFDIFCADNKKWLDDYALFMACKDCHEGKCWLDWGDEMTNPAPEERIAFEKEHKEEIKYYKFIQFLFFREWMALKEYANAADVEIIGDIPFFVSLDSADVWANKEQFQLDTKGYPTHVAGVPPDYFSATGQLWGNPLYDWKKHKEDGYSWWLERIKMQMKTADYLRIDHFRGFEAYWAVPAKEETAVNGSWVKGPGESLFLAIQKELGEDLQIWAEDLGVITPEVEWLRDMFHFPGMKILQFAFQGLDESNYHPHNLTTTNCICYTGTHDNDTTVGWYSTLPEAQKDKIRRYCNCDGGIISLDFIRMCMGSVAKYAIFPIQDLLQTGSETRMNTPGAPMANWTYRYSRDALNHDRAKWLKDTSRLFGRGRSSV